MPAWNLEYVEHFVGYSSIVIKMFSQTEIVLEAFVDRVEYEWIFITLQNEIKNNQ